MIAESSEQQTDEVDASLKHWWLWNENSENSYYDCDGDDDDRHDDDGDASDDE